MCCWGRNFFFLTFIVCISWLISLNVRFYGFSFVCNWYFSFHLLVALVLSDTVDNHSQSKGSKAQECRVEECSPTHALWHTEERRPIFKQTLEHDLAGSLRKYLPGSTGSVLGQTKIDDHNAPLIRYHIMVRSTWMSSKSKILINERISRTMHTRSVKKIYLKAARLLGSLRNHSEDHQVSIPHC